MRILIIGEFSGFAKHLKNGFSQLGHQTTIVHAADGFKGFKAEGDDIFYESPKNLKVASKEIPHTNVLFRRSKSLEIQNELCNRGSFDLIIIICDSFVSNSFLETGVPYNYIKSQKELGAKIILTTCGGDAAYLKYLPEEKFYDTAFPNGVKRHIDTDRLCKVLDLTDIVVATAYDYVFTMKQFMKNDFHKTRPLIYVPLPITIEPSEITSSIGRKIVIFHGIIRPVRKGTQFFEDALNRLRRNYSDLVEIIIDGKMPYDRYTEVLNRMDILLDQTNTYGSGINANLGLMKGKVVFSGNEPEEEELRGYPSPIINAAPDSNDIYLKLEELITHPKKIDSIKQESKNYAIEHLDSKIIAQTYLNSLKDLNHLKSLA